MTPEAIAAVAGLVERYGLPLAVLGILAWAYLTGKLVTPGQVQQLKDQLASMTALYERERVDRITAEKALHDFAPVLGDLADGVKTLGVNVTKAIRGK